MRAERLGIVAPNLLVLSETSLERIIEHVKNIQPGLLVIDSIQTIFSPTIPSAPGSIAQVRESSGSIIVLAKKTGQPILPFTITAERFWEAKKSWDGFQVPYPFSRARVAIAPPIFVPADADENSLNTKRDELQRALDDINAG